MGTTSGVVLDPDAIVLDVSVVLLSDLRKEDIRIYKNVHRSMWIFIHRV